MSHSRRSTAHAVPVRMSRRACSSSANLWTNPAASATLPVYETVTLSWDPTCVSISSANVDLYLSVEQASSSEWQAVHEWTNVPFAAGQYATQLKPTWWNASTGAGQVQAQFSLVPAGQPSWNTPAPAGPVFTVAYNGSYPTVTQGASTWNASGPSVESAADSNKSTGLSGGKLVAAVAVPLAVVALAVIAYVAWNRTRKRPERKRLSAVVDHRMSMISQGTWQPRPSMASQAGSFHPGASQYSAGDRRSYFADPGANRHSTYSTAGSAVGVPSPLRNGGVRPPPPAEMRQTGHGERASRISFAVDDGDHNHRPSFATHRRPGSVQTRSSMYNSQARHAETALPHSTSPQHSPDLSRSGSSTGSLAALAQEDAEYFSRSSTREELSTSASGSRHQHGGNSVSSGRAFSPRHGHQQSFSSSLRNELSASQQQQQHHHSELEYYSPPRMPTHAHTASHSSATPSNPSRLRPMLLSVDTNTSVVSSTSSMPIASFRSSQILSPDEALASYARVTSPVGPAPAGSPFGPSGPSSSSGTDLVRVPTDSQARGAAKGGLSGLIGKSKGMLRSWTGGSIASVLQSDRRKGAETSTAREEKVDEKSGGLPGGREGAKSPFEDPVDEYVYHEKEDGHHAL
ncbi:hypothetical protein JCM10908_000011 [Rhodotorula pacifica]|uniref:uncharacterized protein n=1 Tax=Rhodotorula pacifica TaxID=1495444 RepID=UPI003176DBFB